MVYKRLGRTGLEISRLGFGAMRLPQKDDGKPDPEESVRIIHRAFELGVNYIDTAVMYCHHKSESIVGQALRGWRDRVYVSTKNHYRGADEKTWWRNLENSLDRLDVEYIDIYNIHGINWAGWDRWVKGPNQILSWMYKAHDQGLIRHVCCSFHDTAEVLEKIVGTDAFSSVTLQYNLLDRSLESVFPKMAEKDIGIVVMGPVGGGRLGAESENLTMMLDGARSAAEIALRFVLDNPHVTAAISGMSSLVHVEENCAVGARSEPLSDVEREKVMATLDRYKGLADLYCTGCNYCMPCPHGVDIPGTFSAVNMDRVYGLTEHAKNNYEGLVGKATYCTACGACEPKCPQDIPIRVQLQEAVARFDPAYGRMGVTLAPVARTVDGVQFRARFHNWSDKPNRAAVSLTAETEHAIIPGRVDVSIEEPFQVQDEALTVGAVRDGTDTIRLATNVVDAIGQRTVTSRFVLGECRRVSSMAALCACGDDTRPLAIEDEDQVFVGKEQLNQPYALKAWTGYTPEALLVRAQALDGNDGASAHVALLIDLRDRAKDRPPGFHDSVFLLRVVPETEVARGELNPDQVTVETAAISGGAEVHVEIPWQALGGYQPEEGGAVGFDIVLVVMDAEEHPVFHAGWSANPQVHRDASHLGTLFFAD